MEFKDYQKKVMRTAATTQDAEEQLENAIIGAANEFGELLGILKKWKYQGHPLDVAQIIEECGDGLWYVGLLGDAVEQMCGLSLNDIAQLNVEKLKKRYPDGFSVKRSMNREE